MNDTKLYKHICGYPIEAHSAVERCPGCSGRITPWNTHPAAQEMPAPLGDGDEALGNLAFWLGREYPSLAETLEKALSHALEEMSESLQRRLIVTFRDYLKESRKKRDTGQ